MSSVLVTGASRGVGLAIARKLAGDGYQVVALARGQSEALTAAIEEAKAGQRGSLDFEPFDLNDLEAIPALARRLKQRFGAFYGLVNNAGLGTDGLLTNLHLTQIEALVRLNTLAPIVLTKHILRSMMLKREGRIVNVSSIIAQTGYSGLSVYGATKASMIGFTKSLAREVGPLGVTVNAVAPGFLDTEMTSGLDEQARGQVIRRSAMRRLAEVDDVANAVAYLIGEGARNVTGAVLTIDAGASA
jgi:3-oxoacyl-[acyl-carrier protein] reductase